MLACRCIRRQRLLRDKDEKSSAFTIQCQVSLVRCLSLNRLLSPKSPRVLCSGIRCRENQSPRLGHREERRSRVHHRAGWWRCHVWHRHQWTQPRRDHHPQTGTYPQYIHGIIKNLLKIQWTYYFITKRGIPVFSTLLSDLWGSKSSQDTSCF